ncbi:indolethylamine N-methyltransferase-like [Ptychodera flava]|uniref:indolethylamine N-methyltransferase-like n=1 Tax=Ptychodera flava TaxID=63121 RepID=UPI003969ED54
MATIYRDGAYNTDFDILSFLTAFFLSDHELTQSILEFNVDALGHIINTVQVEGLRMLEVGGGPSILNVILACKRFPEIVFSDFAKPCRHAIEKWVKKEPDAIDWSKVIEKICDMEGNGELWEERQAEARQSIKEIIHCDVHKTNPLEPKVFEPFDVIISTFCLQVACPDRKSFQDALKNITNLLKKGGTLILSTTINESFYLVDGKAFQCIKVDEEFAKTAVLNAGLRITSYKVHQIPFIDDGKVSDAEAQLFLAAVKQ